MIDSKKSILIILYILYTVIIIPHLFELYVVDLCGGAGAEPGDKDRPGGGDEDRCERRPVHSEEGRS